jgi:hypothetical protein
LHMEVGGDVRFCRRSVAWRSEIDRDRECADLFVKVHNCGVRRRLGAEGRRQHVVQQFRPL